MKICKVRPDRSTCSACVATQEMFNVTIAVDVKQMPIHTYCYKSEPVFGAAIMPWFKKMELSPRYH